MCSVLRGKEREREREVGVGVVKRCRQTGEGVEGLEGEQKESKREIGVRGYTLVVR